MGFKLRIVAVQITGRYVFYHWQDDALGKRLFSVKQFTRLQWEAGADVDYAVLQKDAVSVWAAAVEENNPLDITFSQVQNSFHFYIAKS